MTGLDAITSALSTPDVVRQQPLISAGSEVSFGELLSTGIRGLDEKLASASRQVQSLALGESIPPHQVMIALEEARLSMQFALQVRTRLVETYQELMRMQL